MQIGYIYLYEPSFDSDNKIININKFHQLTSTLSLLVFLIKINSNLI